MANTTKQSGKFISLTLDGGTDWSITQDMPQYLQHGLLVKSITILGAAATECKIRNDKVAAQTAAYIAQFLGVAECLQVRYTFGDNGSWMYPAMDAADLTGATEVIIELV